MYSDPECESPIKETYGAMDLIDWFFKVCLQKDQLSQEWEVIKEAGAKGNLAYGM